MATNLIDLVELIQRRHDMTYKGARFLVDSLLDDLEVHYPDSEIANNTVGEYSDFVVEDVLVMADDLAQGTLPLRADDLSRYIKDNGGTTDGLEVYIHDYLAEGVSIGDVAQATGLDRERVEAIGK